MSKYIYLGHFIQESDTIVINDPVDPPDYAIKFENASKGIWNAWLCINNQTKISEPLELIACHDTTINKDYHNTYIWKRAAIKSFPYQGAGIYDNKYYGNNNHVYPKYCKYGNSAWLYMNMNNTDNKLGAGIVLNGVVARTGKAYADEFFIYESINADDKINAIKINISND